MSAEVVVKKRGRPKKTVIEVVGEDVAEAPKKSTKKATKTTAAAKKTSTTKSVKAETEKSALPQKSKSSVLEEVKKLEASKGKAIPTASKQDKATATHSSSNPTTTPQPSNIPAGTSPTPITPPSAKVAASNSRILNEVQALPAKKAGSSDEVSKMAVNEKTADKSNAQQATASTKAADTLLKEATIPTTATTSSTDTTMGRSPTAKPKGPQPLPSKPKAPQPLPSKPTPQSTQPKAKSTPNIPITALNSKIVSDLSARGGARPIPGKPGQLPSNYKPVARKVTRTIVALPIALVTSWVLYERLVLGEDKRITAPLTRMFGAGPEKTEEVVKSEPKTSDSV